MPDAIHVSENRVVPEPDYSVPLSLKPRGASGVGFSSIRMLATIDFDDQSCPLAEEVDDIVSERHLPSKFVTPEPARTEVIPKPHLGVRHLLSQSLGRNSSVRLAQARKSRTHFPQAR